MQEQNTQTSSSANSLLPLIGVVAVIAIVVGAFVALPNDPPVILGDQKRTTQITPTVMPITGGNSDEAVREAQYKDGQYAAVGSYTTPGGVEEIGVFVTIKNGVITATSVEPMAKVPISSKFQNVFSENYKPKVVGKNIADLKLDKISGSSLTPKGFNDALEKIKSQAQG